MSMIKIYIGTKLIGIADFVKHSDAQAALAIMSYNKRNWRFKLTSPREIVYNCTSDTESAQPEIVKERTEVCEHWDCGHCMHPRIDRYYGCVGFDKCEWFQNNKGE